MNGGRPDYRQRAAVAAANCETGWYEFADLR
jgi:hypothetical protein